MTDQNENKTVQESDSLLSPKTGDYVICSIPIENSDKWPENVENVVGRVTNTKGKKQIKYKYIWLVW